MLCAMSTVGTSRISRSPTRQPVNVVRTLQRRELPVRALLISNSLLEYMWHPEVSTVENLPSFHVVMFLNFGSIIRARSYLLGGHLTFAVVQHNSGVPAMSTFRKGVNRSRKRSTLSFTRWFVRGHVE